MRVIPGMVVTPEILCQACFLAVLLGFVVLLPVFEKTISARIVMGRNFLSVVSWSGFRIGLTARVRNLRLARAGFVSVLTGFMADWALLPAAVVLVLSHHFPPCGFAEKKGNACAARPVAMVKDPAYLREFLSHRLS